MGIGYVRPEFLDHLTVIIKANNREKESNNQEKGANNKEIESNNNQVMPLNCLEEVGCNLDTISALCLDSSNK